MTGTFASFNSALTALRYSQIATNVASENISNASTTGYTKRTVVATEGTGTAVPAVWSTSDGTTNYGVTVNKIARNTDDALVARSRTEHATDSYLSTSSDILSRVEDGIGEPSDTGLSKTLTDFKNSWSTLANDTSSTANRATVVAGAQKVATAINAQATSLQSEASSDRSSVQSTVTQVNTLAKSLADTNRTIKAASSSDVDTSDLEDQRDQYLQQLSELTGATSTINDDGTASVSLGGASLVSGNKYGSLAVATGINSDGSSDGSSVTYSVTDTAAATSTVAISGTASGELGAYTDALNTTIPNYLTSLNAVASSLADSVNSGVEGGFDLNGDAGTALFSYTAGSAASTLTVAITDPTKLAADGTSGTRDGTVATSLSKLTAPGTSYSTLVSDFASTVSATNSMSTNQSTLTSAIDDQLASVTGVDTSEELVNLTVAQHQYAAAARVVTTLDSMLSTLISMGS